MHADFTRSDSARPRWRSYLDLLKLNVPELALYSGSAVALAWPLVPHDARFLLTALLFLLFTFCCTTLTNVLDDISGFRDGVDLLTVTKAKKNIVKPLLTHELTVGDAARTAGVIALVALVAMAALASSSPQPLTVAIGLVALIGVVTQYSYGAKLSYRGLGELVIIYGTGATIVLPYMLLTHASPTPQVWWVAAMSGVPYAAQIVCSNTIDRDGDGAAGRTTLSVLLGPKRAPWLSAAFYALFWVAFVAGHVTRVLPSTTLIWLPLAVGHATVLRRFFRGELVSARLLSFELIRLQLVLFPAGLIHWGS